MTWPCRACPAIFLALTVALLGGCGEQRDDSVVQLDLTETVRALGSDDLQISSAADDRLSAIGEPALPALTAAMRQESEAVRIGVVEVVTVIPGDGASALLVQALADPSAQVRAEAAMALRNRQGPTVDQALTRAFNDPNELVRQRVAIACSASCRSPEGIRALVRHALEDPVQMVASTAASGVASLHASEDPALIPTVKAAVEASAPAQLADSDAQRRARAAIVLGGIGDTRAIPVLEQVAAESSEPRRRLKAIYALGEIGDASAVPVLQARLADPATAVYAHDALRRAATRQVPGAADAIAGYTGTQSPVPLAPPT